MAVFAARISTESAVGFSSTRPINGAQARDVIDHPSVPPVVESDKVFSGRTAKGSRINEFWVVERVRGCFNRPVWW